MTDAQKFDINYCIYFDRWLYFNVFNSLAVVVEDSSSSCCVTVKVFPHMTTAALKQQVGLTRFLFLIFFAITDIILPNHFTAIHSFNSFSPQMFLEYGFHPRVQRWVIGQCLCTNQRSLASYGVRQDGDTAFLYLLSARHARLTLQVLQQDQESALLLSPPSLSLATPPLPSTSANGPSSQDRRPYTTLPPRLSTGSNTGEYYITLYNITISIYTLNMIFQMTSLTEEYSPVK